MKGLWRFPGLRAIGLLALAFLYVPIVVLVVLSFGATDSLASWSGFSLRWYGAVLADDNMMRALRNSLVVAGCAALIATVAATMAAVALQRRFRGSQAVETLLALPLVVPEVVAGIAVLLFFVLVGIRLGLVSVILAHVVLVIPLAYLPVRARLDGLDPALAEAAADLYAKPWPAFRRVTLPLIWPGIAAGAMLAFIGSLGDVVVSYFVSGPGSTTLPVYVFAMVRMGVTPVVNAVSTLLLAASVGIFSLSYLIGRTLRQGAPMNRLALLLGLAVVIAPVAPARAAETKELLLFNWSNYTPPELLKRFEAETGIKVTLDTYDTNEGLLSKLQAGGTGYDVVVPTGPTLQAMIRDGLVQKIDAKGMANFHNLRAPFDNPDFDPGRAYSAPYMWGTTGIAYDPATVGMKLDESWKEIFEPRPQVAGKLAMLADMGEVFNAAAFYLGYDNCTAKPEEGQKILELLQRQKPSVKLYSSSGSIDRIASGEVEMHQMYNGAAHRAAVKKPGITYLYPKEGVNLWGDNLAVAKGAPHPENAKMFINFMMDPKNAAEASNYTGYNNGVAGSESMLLPALRDDPAVNAPPDVIARLRPTRECPKASIDLRERVWTRLQR